MESIRKKIVRTDGVNEKLLEEELMASALCKDLFLELLQSGKKIGNPHNSHLLYALGITDEKPLELDKAPSYFNNELPDIDVDFPDSKRISVMKYLKSKYGKSCFGHIGTVSVYKPRSALGELGKKMSIPYNDMEDLKNTILERSSGDARAAMCIADTFTTTDLGSDMLKKYPQLGLASKIEGHVRHHGKHAAGLVVLNDDIRNYASMGRKEDETIQLDKKDAEYLNILKIDALGLRTLSVISDCLEQINMKREKLLEIPLDNKEAFDVLNKGHYSGIFQFEGYALQSLTKQMPVEKFDDIVAITTLARPGPLHSGGASIFINRRVGREPVSYLHDLAVEDTKNTYGVIIYQEQVMQIGRKVGNLSWEDVSNLRKAMSKSLGEEFFNAFWEKFKKGAAENDIKEKEAKQIWESMCSFGSWAYNRCISGECRVMMPENHRFKTMKLKSLYNLYVRNPESIFLQSVYPDGRVKSQKVKTVFKNGWKDCYKFTFDDKTSIVCTKDHKFLINGMWQSIGNAKIWDVFGSSKHGRSVYEKRLVRTYHAGVHVTYDIEMEEHHNYVTEGGLITHNSHAVSYGMISYWCAWLKAHYPLEYAAACLRNSKDEDQTIKTLRELVKEGFEYIPLDMDKSMVNWTVQKGKLVGGFTGVKGVGIKTAQNIIMRRESGEDFMPSQLKKLQNPIISYSDVFECQTKFGKYYDDPELINVHSRAISYIEEIGNGKAIFGDDGQIDRYEKETFVFIGKLKEKNLRDLNEYGNLVKRGGEVIKENNLFLNTVFEDDTDKIICTIGRFQYEKLGKEIVETGKIGSFYLIKGDVRNGWRKIYVTKIKLLEERVK